MTATMTDRKETISTFTIHQEIEINAPIEIAWEAVLEQMGPKGETPDGKPFPLTLEAFPGGRLYRDLGNSAGHLWGHVQVIKPPKLLEICGAFMMSYPAVNHLQYRLTTDGTTTHLELTHRAMGLIQEDAHSGMTRGFEFWVKRMKHLAENR